MSDRVVDVIQDPEPAGTLAGQSESCALGPGEDDEEDSEFLSRDNNFGKTFSLKAVTSRSLIASAMRFASNVFPGSRNVVSKHFIMNKIVCYNCDIVLFSRINQEMSTC